MILGRVLDLFVSFGVAFDFDFIGFKLYLLDLKIEVNDIILELGRGLVIVLFIGARVLLVVGM